MGKKLKLSLATTLLLCVGGSSVLNAAQNADLDKRINALEAQIKEMKQQHSESNDYIEERVDKIETSTMIDKINFGVEFRTRVDNFESQDASGSKSSAKNVWSNRLRLNMSSDITKDMSFTGRLSMYKNWSDTGANYSFSSMDPMQGRRPSDSGVFVERAYVDWTIIDGYVPITLTIGRQPSSDGPSHQFKDNTVRKATYSALSFDGAADGIVATANLQKLTSIAGTTLRVGYGKGYQADTTYTYVGDSGSLKDSNVLGVFLDSGIGIDGALMQLSVVGATDIVSNTNTNTEIGDVMLYTAMLEFTNLANSGVDVFAHYAISQAKPNGEVTLQPGMGMVGLLTSTAGDKEDKDGDAFWLGARYTMPIAMLKNPKIGVEYNQGSKNWFSFTQGSNSLTNKLATRGTAFEAYYIQPINRYAYLRMGAEIIDYDYSGSGYQIGQPMKVSDMSNQVTDKLSNYYLLFNLMY